MHKWYPGDECYPGDVVLEMSSVRGMSSLRCDPSGIIDSENQNDNLGWFGLCFGVLD